MACPFKWGVSWEEIRAYIEALPLSPLPMNYKDSWSGCEITWSIGQIGEGPRFGQPVVTYSIDNCIEGGTEPSYNALLKNLCLDWEQRANIFPDPSYAFDPIPDVTDIPPPTPKEVEKYVGPLMTTGSTPTMSSIVSGPMTIVPAPTAVPVTTRPTTPSIIPSPQTLTTSSGIVEAILGGVGGFVTGGPVGAIAGAATGWMSGGGETTNSPGTQPTGYTTNPLTSGCPTGYKWDGSQCVKEGIVGWIQQTLPGGQTGTLPTTTNGYGNAVMGGFGIPALQPAQVGSTLYGPILRCPKGAVLGRDNLCYQKGTITNRQRKWPRGPRPLLTGGEMKVLRKVKTLENKVKRAWQAAGKPGYTRPRRK